MITLENIQEKWQRIKDQCKTKTVGVKISAILGGCTLAYIEQTEPATLWITTPAKFHYNFMSTPYCISVVKWAISTELGERVQVGFLDPVPRTRSLVAIEIDEILERLRF